eukprot:156609_1
MGSCVSLQQPRHNHINTSIPPRTRINVHVLGDRRVGITTLLEQYTQINADPETTRYEKHVTSHGRQYLLDICDFTKSMRGTEDFHGVHDGDLRKGDIFICCFAINSQESFQRALKYCQKIERAKDGEDEGWSIALVATKCDLIERGTTHERILCQHVKTNADKSNIHYIQTSNTTGNATIDTLFQRSISQL